MIKNLTEPCFIRFGAYSEQTDFSISQPVEFSIDFFDKGLRIQYSVCIDLGYFLTTDIIEKLYSEELMVNGESVFSRKEDWLLKT